MSSAMRATLVALTMFAAPAVTAQQISIPQSSLTAGAAATVEVFDPANADQVVTVTIDNGSTQNPESEQIDVLLDSDGMGVATWMVPNSQNWWSAVFRLRGATSEYRVILPKPKSEDGDLPKPEDGDLPPAED